MAKEYCGYKSIDGKVFDTKEEAERNDIKTELERIKREYRENARNLIHRDWIRGTNYEITREKEKVFYDAIKFLLKNPKLLQRVVELYEAYVERDIVLKKQLVEMDSKKSHIWAFWRNLI